VDDVDGDDDGRCGGSQSGDNGIRVWAYAKVVVIIVDKDRGGRGRRHVAWIKRWQSLH
jgi:hypothetical protein